MSDLRTAFFAYPGSPPSHAEVLRDAIRKQQNPQLVIASWESLSTLGFKIDKLIRDRIKDVEILFADISYHNFNVNYEIGYALGLGKIVIPTLLTSIQISHQPLSEIGLLDTIGQLRYENSDELAAKMADIKSADWMQSYTKARNYQRPLFVLDTLYKTDFRNNIFQALDDSQLRYRTYDPAETPRLTAAQAIAEVSASIGAVIPIIQQSTGDSTKNNLRAAFIAGLCHGMGIEPIIIQQDGGPAPLDYRDFITNTTFRLETIKHITEYCIQTLPKLQDRIPRISRPETSALSKIDVGSPAAENETDRLAEYFLNTSEYQRATRAEAGVVVGRKGAGKSAIFFQLSQLISRNKGTCLLELRPASHNLSEIRSALMEVKEQGIYDHTLAGFWTSIMYRELVLHMRSVLLPRSKNDFNLQKELAKIETDLGLTEYEVSGDFASRLESAVEDLVEQIRTFGGSGSIREKITNLLFSSQIPKLRDVVLNMTTRFDEVVILIDDLDKGWPVTKVENHDAQIIRHLLEVLYKIQKDLKRSRVPFKHLLFIRSDMYETLVENTADRGKYNPIKINWSDREQLKLLLHSRILSNGREWGTSEEIGKINSVLSNGATVFDTIVDHSLMRPRFLIDILERTISVAANRRHGSVWEEDLTEALRQMSLYLVSDFAYEMRDVFGVSENILYAFIGCEKYLSVSDVSKLLEQVKSEVSIQEQIEALLWYGCLGLWREGGRELFIYDLEYDFRRLQAEKSKMGTELYFVVNEAFFKGLT